MTTSSKKEDGNSAGDELEQHSEEQLEDSRAESDGGNEDLGWWTNSPSELHINPEAGSSSDNSSGSSDTQSWSSVGDTRVDRDGPVSKSIQSESRSSSMIDMLENENTLGLDVSVNAE